MGYNNLKIKLGSFEELGDIIMPLRHSVFHDEQKIPVGIMDDEHNERAIQCAVFNNASLLVATARLAEINGESIIGQVAVLRSERGKSYGSTAVTALIDFAEKRGVSEILIHAQTHATGFYRRLGFELCGEPYYEGEFELVDMKRFTKLAKAVTNNK